MSPIEAPSRRGALLLGLLLLAAPGRSADPPAPTLELVSATCQAGQGKEPPPGAAAAAAQLIGTLRIRGFAVRKSDLSIVLAQASRTRRLKPKGWAALEPTLYRFTVPWPADLPAENCTARVALRRGRIRLEASAPVQVVELPTAAGRSIQGR